MPAPGAHLASFPLHPFTAPISGETGPGLFGSGFEVTGTVRDGLAEEAILVAVTDELTKGAPFRRRRNEPATFEPVEDDGFLWLLEDPSPNLYWNPGGQP